MKKKIFISYIILVFIGITITAVFISEFTRYIYKQEIKQRLITTAQLIDYDIYNKSLKGEKIDFNASAKDYAKILGEAAQKDISLENVKARVTFIDFSGKVIGESETDYTTMENHLGRKEIQEAIQGKTGEDIRFSKTIGMDYLYLAVPMKYKNTIARVSLPLVQLKKIDEILIYYTLIGMLAGLAFTILLALKFSASLIKPAQELISVSEEISRGNYSIRARINSRDEFGQLADTFNKMADALQRTVADLVEKNIRFDSVMNSMTNGLVAVDDKYRIILINEIACNFFSIEDKDAQLGKNIIETIRNRQINSFIQDTVENGASEVNEITIINVEDRIFRVYTSPIKSADPAKPYSGGIVSIHDITSLKKLEQIRTEFVSNVTHELKTPLTSIRGFVETLRSGAIEDAAVADRFLEIIDIEAERLYTLINDILQLSEIESGRKDSNIGNYNLKSIVDEVVSILKGSAEKKSINIKTEVDDNIELFANRNRIKQMLINLIDNAIKYNVENGEIEVTGHKETGKIVIIVRDTGIGIAPQHLDRIFERFYRVDKGRSRNMGGTGLGLSIVKHIVSLYNGDIRVNSKPGRGTEFVIQLPA